MFLLLNLVSQTFLFEAQSKTAAHDSVLRSQSLTVKYGASERSEGMKL